MNSTTPRVNELLEKIDPSREEVFYQWIKENKFKFSRETIYLLKAGKTNYKKKNLEDKVKDLEALITRFLNEGLSELSEGFNPLIGKKWELYFFATSEVDNTYAKLSRTILYINASGFPVLHRPINDIRTVGTIRNNSDDIFEIEFSDRSTFFFNLDIKVYLNVIGDICLGLYTANENGVIYGGQVVFYAIPSDKEVKTRALSIFQHRDELLLVPKPIRTFLFRREMSYFKLPKAINSLKSLFNHNNAQPKRLALFFEPKDFCVFLSTPTFSLVENDYKQRSEGVQYLIENVKSKFQDHPQKDILSIEYLGSKRAQNNQERAFQEVLESIMRSTLFVLIIKEKVVSFSYVELGLALSYAKKILIFGNSEHLPQKLSALRGTVDYIHFFPDDDFKAIADILFLNIIDLLPPINPS